MTRQTMIYCALIGLIQKCFPGAACIAVFCLKIEYSNLLQLITNGKNFLILNFLSKIDALYVCLYVVVKYSLLLFFEGLSS